MWSDLPTSPWWIARSQTWFTLVRIAFIVQSSALTDFFLFVSLSLLSKLFWKKLASFLAFDVAIWSFWWWTARSYVNRSLKCIHLNPGRYLRLQRISQNFVPFFVEIGVVLMCWATHLATFFFSNSTQPSVNVTFFFFLFAFFVTRKENYEAFSVDTRNSTHFLCYLAEERFFLHLRSSPSALDKSRRSCV